MKKLIIISFIALTIVSCKTAKKLSSEVYKENIITDFFTYNSLIINQEFEKSLTYLVPEFFDIIPKEQVIQLMKQLYNNPDTEIELNNPKILNIKNKEKIDNKYYSLINYLQKIKMKVKDNDEDDIDEKLVQNLTLSMLKSKFGSENVKYDSLTKFYVIISKKDAFAVSKNGIDNWKFVVIDNKNNPILKKLIPEELLKNLNN